MGISIAETADRRHPKRTLIETKYLGDHKPFVGTEGEAFFNVNSNSWHYRPYKDKVKIEFGKEVEGFFIGVHAEELDCANDEGWVRGNYLGLKNIPKVGKATWDEGEDAWKYKPKGMQKTFIIPEKDFELVRDEDVFDK